jgi:hypothetical protein
VNLFLIDLSLLSIYEWHNNSFLSSSNHTMILSLFFHSFMCQQSYQPIFLYFVHQYLFPFEHLSISIWVMSSITPINLSFLEKRMKKWNINCGWLWRLKKEWRKETIVVIDGGRSVGYTRADKNGVSEKKQGDSVETTSSTSFLSSHGLLKQIWVGPTS